MGLSEAIKKKLVDLGLRDSDETSERREIEQKFRDTTGYTNDGYEKARWGKGTLTNMYERRETPAPLNFPYVEVTNAPNKMQSNYTSAETLLDAPVVYTPYSRGELDPKMRRHEQEHVNQFYSGVNPAENYEPADVQEGLGDDELAKYISYRLNPKEMAAWQASDPGSRGGWEPRLWEDMAKRFIALKGGPLKDQKRKLEETVRNRMATDALTKQRR